MRKEKQEYFDYIFGLDLECSTIYFKDDKTYKLKNCDYVNIRNNNDILSYDTDMDSFCCFINSFAIGSINITNGYIDYEKVIIGRTYDELNNNLNKISDYYYNMDKDKRILCYIHNLAYDFSFLINNVEFFRDAEMFATDTNKPIKVTCKNIEFRCSNALFGQSIENLGHIIKLPKLDYEYEKLRTPTTRLTNKEIEYNFRDVEIMLRSIYRLFTSRNYRKVSEIKLTKTAVTRYDYRMNDNVNEMITCKNKDGKIVNKRLYNDLLMKNDFSKATTKKQLEFWEDVFKGGLVYSNPKYCSKILDNVMSYDFSSDYPFQILYRQFPTVFRVVNNDNYKYKLFNDAIEHIKNVGADIYIKDKMSDNFIQGIIKVANLKSKYTFFPLMEQSLVDNLRNYKDCTILNGKVKEVFKECSIKFSYIDLITLVLFYDFNLVSIEYLENCTKIKPVHQYTKNCVIDSGRKKVEYKKYKKLVEKNNTHKLYTKEEIQDNFIRDNINRYNTYNTQLDFIENQLLNAKGDLNANYGINAMHLLHDTYYYDYLDREFKTELGDFNKDYFNKFQASSYIVGLYIPGYAQASILYFVYKFLEHNVDCIYIDTDSFKILQRDYEKVKYIIDEYNNTISDKMHSLGYTFDFGTLDSEGILDKFVTLGSKCYLFLQNDRITAKISGFPKASEKYNIFYEKCNRDFDKLVKKYFHFNTYFTPRVTKKLSAQYKYNKYDLNLKGYKETLYSGCLLQPVGLHLRNTQSPLWSAYKRTVEQYFNLKVGDDLIIIDDDELKL